MRRREFITLFGGALPAWACAARAQEPRKVVRIGLLGPLSASAQASRVEAIRQGLRDHGYIEGTNLTIEYRWAEGRYERLLELAGELVRANVDVIITYGTPASLAAKQATTTIPIVVALIGRPDRVRPRYRRLAAQRECHGAELLQSATQGEKSRAAQGSEARHRPGGGPLESRQSRLRAGVRGNGGDGANRSA